MAEGDSNKKVANSLVALSSAAVLAVYSAGYVRTRPAAERFALQAAGRRPAAPPIGANAAAPITSVSPAAVNKPAAAPSPPTSASPTTPAASTASRAAIATTPATPEISRATSDVPGSAAITSPTIASIPTPLAPLAAPVAAPVTAPIADAAAPPADQKAPEAAAPVSPPKGQYKDGTYLGWGTSRHGDIQASVVIEGGRIASATIAQCWTRYSCDVIARVPPQVAQRQSTEVDFVSGATQSVNAFYYAVVEALSQAK